MQRQLRLRSVLIVVILTTVAAERRAHAASPMPGGGACMVESTPILFGNYNPIRRKDVATVGMIHYRCLGSHQRLTIGLSPGDSGSFAARVMSRGQRSITYNLYLDPAATQVWGDGTRGAQAYVVYSPRVNTEVSIPIYGRMRGGQNASAGGYRDNLSLIVSY